MRSKYVIWDVLYCGLYRDGYGLHSLHNHQCAFPFSPITFLCFMESSVPFSLVIVARNWDPNELLCQLKVLKL